MRRPNGKVASGCLICLVWPLVFATQLILTAVALVCFFGIAVQVVDKGGGASGAHARRQVTVVQRTIAGLFLGTIGLTSFYTAVKMSDNYRIGRR